MSLTSKVVWNLQVHWNARGNKGLIVIECLHKVLPTQRYGTVIDIENIINIAFSVIYYLKLRNAICLIFYQQMSNWLFEQ